MAAESVVIDIAASPARAWRAVTDVEDWPRWTTSMTEVKRLDEGALRVGSQARIKQPGLPTLVWEVTDLVEGASFSWVARTPGVVATASHEVVPTANGSRLTLGVAWTGIFGAVTAALVGKRTLKSITVDANGHKACAESAA